MSDDFLVEIGCEELPPIALPLLSQAFKEGVENGLKLANLSFDAIAAFATPRRLALRVTKLASSQPTIAVERKGPAVSSAFDDEGKPSKACLGFARSCGVEVAALTRLKTEGGEWLLYRGESAGSSTLALLPAIVSDALSSLPIPKMMRWGNSEVSFVRPVHSVLMLYGEAVVPATILGQAAGRQSVGHRFHHPEVLSITKPADYEQALSEAFVVVDFTERRARIKQQITALASAHSATVVMNEALLDEVCALVEWPKAMLIEFDEAFLCVPQEALIAAMESHQKCFALTDNTGALVAKFITVANIDSLEPERIIKGNQRVMRARLSDAQFFYEQDLKSTLSSALRRTKSVVFQKSLGTLFDKSLRVSAVAQFIGARFNVDAAHTERAATLAKCDLMSEMVGEFPSLQGIMGRYYAVHDGEAPAVSEALYEQYLPRFAGDELPRSSLGGVLAIAERIDTLVGIFGIGQKPSGTKDPFKLRRAALGLIRLLLASPIALSLDELINTSIQSFTVTLKSQSVKAEVKQFILDRLMTFYTSRGFSASQVKAVLQVQHDNLLDVEQRIVALGVFVQLSEAKALSAANKRVSKLLTKATGLGNTVNESLLEVTEEQELYKQVALKLQAIAPLLAVKDYQSALCSLATLQAPIDAFFEHVMVMVDDEQLRLNRLNLLHQLHALFLQVADISLLQVD